MSLRAQLERRAAVFAAIRRFFAARGVLEVTTDLIHPYAPSDPFGRCLRAVDEQGADQGWLLPSPELAMKPLLAAGAGDIFQICKAFRAGESGPRHRPEFTLVEWYRNHWDYTALASETVDLINVVFPGLAETRYRYVELWGELLQMEPFALDVAALARRFAEAGKPPPPGGLSAREMRDLAFAELIEPRLPSGVVTVFDFPAEQTAMACRRDDDPRWALRFEVFVNGVEIANGYSEQNDSKLQRRAWREDNRERRARGLPERVPDEMLLAAIDTPGLPHCAGVALGFDRLLMVRDGRNSLDDGWCLRRGPN